MVSFLLLSFDKFLMRTLDHNKCNMTVKGKKLANAKLQIAHFYQRNILRKTIEGYLDSVPSLTFNTIKTKLIMHAFHSSR